MPITFLFWNIFKRPLEARVARMAAAHSVDVVMLAECDVNRDQVVQALNREVGSSYTFPADPAPNLKIKVFTRLPSGSLAALFNDPLGRLTVYRLRTGNSPDVLLHVVHLISKFGTRDADQLAAVFPLLESINLEEAAAGSDRSVVVGDFNMNPFDYGMVAANGFHGMMTKQQARRQSRTVQGRDYRYFYNPMWGHLGDRTDGPSGTYHYDEALPVQYFWNVFDQVLLRPSLMDSLSRLEILTTDGVEALLTDEQVPRKGDISDHLPILFRLDL